MIIIIIIRILSSSVTAHGAMMKRVSAADSRKGIEDQSNLNTAIQRSLLYISDSAVVSLPTFVITSFK